MTPEKPTSIIEDKYYELWRAHQSRFLREQKEREKVTQELFEASWKDRLPQIEADNKKFWEEVERQNSEMEKRDFESKNKREILNKFFTELITLAVQPENVLKKKVKFFDYVDTENYEEVPTCNLTETGKEVIFERLKTFCEVHKITDKTQEEMRSFIQDALDILEKTDYKYSSDDVKSLGDVLYWAKIGI